MSEMYCWQSRIASGSQAARCCGVHCCAAAGEDANVSAKPSSAAAAMIGRRFGWAVCPMSAKSFGTLFARLGERAGMAFPIFPHMLRHACGYALANAGHDTRSLQAWLGHKNIQHTVRYTELAPDRFKNFWR